MSCQQSESDRSRLEKAGSSSARGKSEIETHCARKEAGRAVGRVLGRFHLLLSAVQRYTGGMKKLRFVLVLAVLLLVLGVGLWVGFFAPKWLGFVSGPKVYNTATVLRQVQTLSQLVTVKYVMEKVVVLEDVKWFGENRVLLIAHGIVKAGVDLSELRAEDLEVSGNKITIRLPPAQVTDAYLDDQQTRVVERTTGLLRMFDKDLEQSARQNAVSDIRRAARTAGILKDADERAQAQLKSLFLQMGFEQIEFRSQ